MGKEEGEGASGEGRERMTTQEYRARLGRAEVEGWKGGGTRTQSHFVGLTSVSTFFV